MSGYIEKKLGVGVIIKRDSLLLLGKRKSKLGYDTWGPPGGLRNQGESIEEAAQREVREEVGLSLKNIVVIAVIENLFSDQNHYSESSFVEALYNPGVLTNKEPDKCNQWAWFEWHHLPSPLFSPFESFVRQGYLNLIFEENDKKAAFPLVF